jgi:hypothetical protein
MLPKPAGFRRECIHKPCIDGPPALAATSDVPGNKASAVPVPSGIPDFGEKNTQNNDMRDPCFGLPRRPYVKPLSLVGNIRLTALR